MGSKSIKWPLKLIALVVFVAISIAETSALTGSEIYKALSKSIYTVEVYIKGELTAKGSAVAISNDILVTNCHVVDSSDKIFIMNKEGEYFASVFKNFSSADICLLKVADIKLLPVVMKYSNSLEIGTPVYAIGSPYGFSNSFSQGVLSQKRFFNGNAYLQTDTAISPGSSGGGLFNSEGELIGITTLKVNEIGLAVAVDMLIPFSANNNYSEMQSEEKVVTKGQDNSNQKKEENNTKILDEGVNDNNNKLEYIEQTTSIAKHGEYGKNKIILVRDIYGCGFYIPGITESGSQYGSAVLFPEFSEFLFVFPTAATLQEAINSANKIFISIFYEETQILENTDSSLWLVDNRYKPPQYSGYKMLKVANDVLRKDSFVIQLKFDLLKRFIEDDDFYILYDQKRKEKVVSFGLWGFSEAVSNYSDCMKAFESQP